MKTPVTGQPITLKVYRGVNPNQSKPTDPGDLGKGTYYTTSLATARSYGIPLQGELHLQNPKVINAIEAAELVEKYGTVNGYHRMRGALALTRDMKAAGYDSLVVSGWDSQEGYVTIVVFPKETK